MNGASRSTKQTASAKNATTSESTLRTGLRPTTMRPAKTMASRRGEVEDQASRRHARILHISSAAIQSRLASARGSSAFQPIFISWS